MVGDDVELSGKRGIGGSQRFSLDGDLVCDCLVTLLDRSVALTDGDNAGRDGDCCQHGQYRCRGLGETHCPPVLSQVLTDEHVLRHAPDRGCDGGNTIGRDHRPAALNPRITQIHPERLGGVRAS